MGILRSPSKRRNLLLLLGALAAPCLVLIVLGIQIITKERELAIRRLLDDPRLVVARVDLHLMTTLERIKLDEAERLAASKTSGRMSPSTHREVALVGWVRDGRLSLPWDDAPSTDTARQALSRPEFRRAITEGERLEFGPRQFLQAAEAYAHAKTLGRQRVELDYADLLRARVLVKEACECTPQTREIYERLLSSETIDDQGIPIALYAARELVDARAGYGSVLDALERALQTPSWIQPLPIYLARTLLNDVIKNAPADNERRRGVALLTRVASEVGDIEQALELQREFSSLAFPSGDAVRQSESVWRLFGKDRWLITQARGMPGLPPFAIALRADPILASVQTDSALLDVAGGALKVVSAESAGQPLGAHFPELRLVFPVADQRAAMKRWAFQSTFYAVALTLVLAVTVLGGYSSWRNTRRELADMRSQFVASVSHELRTPLTAIRMFAETLQMERPLDYASRGEYLNTIVNESERLTRLINNVLDFSRIEKGQKVYHLDRVPLDVVVKQAAATMQYPLARQGFELHVVTEAALPEVNIDVDAIQQALLNLLGNAIKYSHDKRRIDLTLSGKDGHAVIEVTDYGLGISPADRLKIFERFYRASNPENARIPGAGLGLSLVDHIVRAHGGFVDVTTTPGEGSTFAIHLPIGTPA